MLLLFLFPTYILSYLFARFFTSFCLFSVHEYGLERINERSCTDGFQCMPYIIIGRLFLSSFSDISNELWIRILEYYVLDSWSVQVGQLQ